MLLPPRVQEVEENKQELYMNLPPGVPKVEKINGNYI